MCWAGTGLQQSQALSQGHCQGSSQGYRDNTSGTSCQIYHCNEKVRVSLLKGLSHPIVDQCFVPYLFFFFFLSILEFILLLIKMNSCVCVCLAPGCLLWVTTKTYYYISSRYLHMLFSCHFVRKHHLADNSRKLITRWYSLLCKKWGLSPLSCTDCLRLPTFITVYRCFRILQIFPGRS